MTKGRNIKLQLPLFVYLEILYFLFTTNRGSLSQITPNSQSYIVLPHGGQAPCNYRSGWSAMFMKIKKIFAVCMVFVLIACTGTELALNRVDPANASALEAESSLSSPQPEWQSLEFPILPPPRIGSSLTLNPINKIALLFGGHNSSQGELNDLWITDGFGWMQFFTPHSPGERSGAGMAYDEARQVTVLFGGSGNQTLLGDTWLFNGVDWIQQHPKTSPSPRSAFSMAYDPDRG
jgi:hypothetical protein